MSLNFKSVLNTLPTVTFLFRCFYWTFWKKKKKCQQKCQYSGRMSKFGRFWCLVEVEKNRRRNMGWWKQMEMHLLRHCLFLNKQRCSKCVFLSYTHKHTHMFGWSCLDDIILLVLFRIFTRTVVERNGERFMFSFMFWKSASFGRRFGHKSIAGRTVTVTVK